MTDVNFPLTADSDFDDLPRTLRREKEARARQRQQQSLEARRGEPPTYLAHAAPPVYGDDPMPATVRRFDVSFVHLMMFFIKAALAAIPALILIGVVLYFAGQAIQTHFPDLVRMKILVTFPG